MKNKFITIVCIFMLISSASFSQNEPVVLIKSKEKQDRTAFICPEIKFTKLVDKWEYFGGLKGGFCFNHKYVFGAEFSGINSDNGFSYDSIYVRNAMFYGGLYIDYIVQTGIPLQISFPTMLGVGGSILYDKLNSVTQHTEILELGDFLVAEPKINLELNLIRAIRIGMGCGYRMVFNSHIRRLTSKDFSGLVFNVNLKFGGF